MHKAEAKKLKNIQTEIDLNHQVSKDISFDDDFLKKKLFLDFDQPLEWHAKKSPSKK